MKIRLMRQSGDPTNVEDRDAFQAAFREMYDKAAERAGLDMLKLNRMVSFCERLLVKKHNKEVLVDMPKSAKAWTNLISKYDDVPILVARTADGKEIVLVIMDALS